MKKIMMLVLALNGLISMLTSAAAEVSVQLGAELYRDRCAFCHGNQGMGEGLLPLTIDGYASTNLREQRFLKDPNDGDMIRRIIVEGLSSEEGVFMPPWQDELDPDSLNSLVLFIQLFYNEPEKAEQLLADVLMQVKPSVKLGRRVFQTRCILCHGKKGEGDGKLARVIKNPPPFNLTLSRAPDEYLYKIIALGGESVQRSPRMPPWEGTLTAAEILSIIDYIKTLRRD